MKILSIAPLALPSCLACPTARYECAPYFGIASAQIDENLMVMELMEEIAAKHGLACLLAEKPFKGVNG